MSASADFAPGPLNPGNVVSAGLRLYRDRFQVYFKLSVQAYLWLIVPVYGWAKYFMLTGVMSRLAFQELIQQPESLEAAKGRVAPKLWSFLGLGILLILVIAGIYFGLALAGGLLGALVGFAVGGTLASIWNSEIGTGLGILVGVLVFLALFLIGLIWIVARLLIAEVPLATEAQITPTDSIARSWHLTQLSVLRIQFIVLAAFLITLPVIIVTNTVPQFAITSVPYESPAYWTISLIGVLLSLVGNMVVLPFWQTVKGVLYYDLRSRREGLDLQR